MADSLIKVGNLQYDTGDPTGAMTSFREAIALLEPLAESHPTKCGSGDGLATGHRSIGDLQNHIGEADNARQSFRRAISLWEGLLEDCPELAAYQTELARSLMLPRLAQPVRGGREEHDAAVKFTSDLSRTILLIPSIGTGWHRRIRTSAIFTSRRAPRSRRAILPRGTGTNAAVGRVRPERYHSLPNEHPHSSSKPR